MKDRLRKRERDGHADGPQRRMDGERMFSAMITPRFSFMLEMKKGRTRGQGLRGHAGFRAEGAGKGRTGTPERPHMADRARRTVFRREVVNSVHCTPYRAGFRENGGACRNPCRKRAETRGCGHAVPCRSGGGPHRAAFLIRGDARYKLFPPAVRNGNCQVVRSRFSGLGEAYGRVPAGGPGTVSNIGPSGHRVVS